MSEAKQKIKQFKLDMLKDLLSQCTEEQQKFFKRMYPYEIDDIPYNKIEWGIQQCENTIKKNNKKNGDNNG